jgi:hypothetical protein
LAGRKVQQTLPDLLIAKAGKNFDNGPDGEGERWEDIEALLAFNVRAV